MNFKNYSVSIISNAAKQNHGSSEIVNPKCCGILDVEFIMRIYEINTIIKFGVLQWQHIINISKCWIALCCKFLISTSQYILNELYNLKEPFGYTKYTLDHLGKTVYFTITRENTSTDANIHFTWVYEYDSG